VTNAAGDDVAVQPRDLVAYVGLDDTDLMLWHGQPGRVVITDLWPREVVVSFVNGPTLCLVPADVAALDETSYRERAHRVLALVHPTDDGRRIPQSWAELEPWEDDEVARGNRG